MLTTDAMQVMGICCPNKSLALLRLESSLGPEFCFTMLCTARPGALLLCARGVHESQHVEAAGIVGLNGNIGGQRSYSRLNREREQCASTRHLVVNASGVVDDAGPVLTVSSSLTSCGAFCDENRYDEKKGANPSPNIAGFNFEAPTAAGLKAAFKRAGLGTR